MSTSSGNALSLKMLFVFVGVAVLFFLTLGAVGIGALGYYVYTDVTTPVTREDLTERKAGKLSMLSHRAFTRQSLAEVIAYQSAKEYAEDFQIYEAGGTMFKIDILSVKYNKEYEPNYDALEKVALDDFKEESKDEDPSFSTKKVSYAPHPGRVVSLQSEKRNLRSKAFLFGDHRRWWKIVLTSRYPGDFDSLADEIFRSVKLEK